MVTHVRDSNADMPYSENFCYPIMSCFIVQFASSVAFDAANPGYVHWPNGSADNFLQLNLKFKTASSSGLLFYGSDYHRNASVSLALVNGGLVMRSQGEELVTIGNTHYGDNQWHVVTATHDRGGLRLDIDDFDTVM
jgi:Laminin G domain.